MQHTVQWIDEGYILSISMSGKLDIDVFMEVSNKVRGMLDAYPNNTVQMLFDMKGVTGFTSKLPQLTKATKPIMSAPNSGWYIGYNYGSNSFFKFLASATAQMFGVQSRIVDSYEEAIAFAENAKAKALKVS